MRVRIFPWLMMLMIPGLSSGQSSPGQIEPILARPIQTPGVVENELQQFLIRRVPKLPNPRSSEEWTQEAARMRKYLLDDIVFHGWPREWVEAPPKFEEAGVMNTGHGYRMRKLRYEIVPGFEATAILYEPESLHGKVPAVLNVNGHEDAEGKAVEYKQKRCINFALQGMLALSLEWIGMGELNQPENQHDFLADLDLVGANGVGLFYLGMRKGLDYLSNHPNVDRSRLGVTGLSGGGWQTIVLGALDERVAVAVPVAGYGSLEADIVHPSDTDEVEEDATDFHYLQEFTHLTAMRAPRPTLLIYNAQDNCCFRAPFEKHDLYENIKAFFALYGKQESLAWHQNTDPGTHNYQIDNREQAYRFFSRYFNLPPIEHEIRVDRYISTPEELRVGLPKDNLTTLGLAKKLANEIHRELIPSDPAARKAWADAQRANLKGVVRYPEQNVESAWRVYNTWNKGVETLSYRFGLNNGLSATGVWLKAITAADGAPATIILDDQGKKAVAATASDRINRGEQVLALDLILTGDSSVRKPSAEDPAPHGLAEYSLLMAGTGVRPIGVEAGQLIALARWLKKTTGAQQVRLDSTGIRSQVAALIASALEPSLFSEVLVHKGMKSLGALLDTPVKYRDAPDLFCLDLYKEFDLDRLVTIAEPTPIRQ